MMEIGISRIFSEKLGCFNRTSYCLTEFATSTPVFREVMGTYVKINFLEVWPHRFLCFAGLRTQKRKSELTSLLTSTLYMYFFVTSIKG